MKGIETLKSTVLWMLTNEKETRNDDELLIALVDAKICPAVMHQDYITVAKHRAEYGLPSREAITRLRRMLQNENPDLKGVDYVTRMRVRREKQWKAYVRAQKNE